MLGDGKIHCLMDIALSVLLLLISWIRVSVQYGTGAPLGSCSSMVPQHGVSGKDLSTSPYSIYVSDTRYSRGSTLTVTINGTQPFKGFLILANTPAFAGSIGSFAATSSSAVQTACTNGLTHTSNTPWSTLSFTWTAPATVQGSLYFYATVVQDQMNFWVQLKSALIWDGQSSTASTIVASLGSSATVSTASISTTGCGLSKSCFASPSGCSGNDCVYLLTWQMPSSSAVQFSLQAQTSNTPGYVSVGFSKVKGMEGMTVVNCVATGSGAAVTQTYSSGNQEPSAISGGSNLVNVSATVSSSVMYCFFTWNNDAAARKSTEQFDLTNSYYVVMARGQSVGNTAGNIYEHRENPVSMSSKVVVASPTYKYYSGSVSSKTWLVKVHGAFMSAAWMLCSTTAVILARFYKRKWLDSKLCGEKIWFAWHRGLAIAGTLLTAIAFILVYIAVGGWTSVKGLPYDAHAYLGVIVTALAIANPIMGFFRCNPGTKKRKMFNWAHWIVGNAVLILAGAALLIGLQMDSSVCPWWLLYVAITYVAWFGVSYFTLMLEEFLTSRYGSIRPPSQHLTSGIPMTSADKDAAEPPKRSLPCDQDFFKGVFFVVYLIVTIATTGTVAIAILASASS